jgi:hypothetical protein
MGGRFTAFRSLRNALFLGRTPFLLLGAALVLWGAVGETFPSGLAYERLASVAFRLAAARRGGMGGRVIALVHVGDGEGCHEAILQVVDASPLVVGFTQKGADLLGRHAVGGSRSLVVAHGKP